MRKLPTLFVLFSLVFSLAPRSWAGQDATVNEGTPLAWAMGTTGIVSEMVYMRYDLLGGFEPRPEVIAEWKQRLKNDWDIVDRGTLLGQLNWLVQTGHRKEFSTLALRVLKASPEEIKAMALKAKGDPEAINKLDFVLKYTPLLKEKGLFAWDCCRHIFLCRIGYLVGYLSKEEAVNSIMKSARLLQKTYDSWTDMGQNYLWGREFWSYKHTSQDGRLYHELYLKLLNTPSSPWNTNKWNMDLSTEKTVLKISIQ